MTKVPRIAPAKTEKMPRAATWPPDHHPDYVASRTGAESPAAASPAPAADVLSGAMQQRVPAPVSEAAAPAAPLGATATCAPVSGRYAYVPRAPGSGMLPRAGLPGPGGPRPAEGAVTPFNALSIVVRVDVDRFLPQNRMSVEWSQAFPRRRAHVVAEVTSDSCVAPNHRVVTADIVYRDGDGGAIPGHTLTFRAQRTTAPGYGLFSLTLAGGGMAPRTYDLRFLSEKFDDIEFEVDRVANAGSIVTAYGTGEHPNHPADLPDETLSLATVFERAGFSVAMSPETTVIPTSGAGADGTWSDAELHNAMVAFWSRFADRPQWAMWVLFAARHDDGPSLGGKMFDNIGDNHRQGTAIFTDSFIKDVTPGDTDPAAWRRRMQFWTAIHEMGHAFNLAHAWQKALGNSDGAPGDPWIPLANDPQSRSFMNYPFRQAVGGEKVFFSDFRFRFSDDELLFMRHAPRRFVQMGDSSWFVNHAFEAPDALLRSGRWTLVARSNRGNDTYRFMEPVTMELKLTNSSDAPVQVDSDLLRDGRHVTVFLQREGGHAKRWRPLMTGCHRPDPQKYDVGESLFGAHTISAASNGWLIDEPGFYKVQAAVDMGDEIVVSNVWRLFVAQPLGVEEARLAPDYFTEDVARVLAFNGAPALDKAEDTLRKFIASDKDHPAVAHAKVALSDPNLRAFKVLEAGDSRERLKIRAKRADIDDAAKTQTAALLDDAQKAADTLGHIPYFGQLRTVAEALEDHGAEKAAIDVMEKTIDLMVKRNVLPSVIDNARRRLARRKS